MSKFGFDTEPVRLALVTPTIQQEHPHLTDTPLDFALRYADLGWYVIPVRIDKKPVDGYGLSTATKDPALIRKIWGQHPAAGIAIACARSGLVVMDIDPRNGGYETLAKLEAEHGVVYSSVTSTTQGGGEHRVFSAEPDGTYPGTLGPGIDIKYNGYILVEPSQGQQGRYAWQSGKSPMTGSLPTRAPSLLLGRTATPSLSVAVHPASVIVAPEVYADLERALTLIPPELGYNDGWFKVLQGLSRLSNKEKAYTLARDWSLRSNKDNHTSSDFDTKWRSCMREDYTVSYQSVFHVAKQYGKLPEPEPSSDEPQTESLWQPIDLGDGKVEAVNYLVDEFLAHSLMVFVGKPGMGKSTAMVALCAVVAGHILPGCPLRSPAVGRKIIYITEDTEQFKRNLIALEHNFGLSFQEVKKSFVVIPARRVSAKELLGLKQIVADNCVTHESGVVMKPWLIFDTTSSSFHLEDENSNSEVAAVLAMLKSEFFEKMKCSVCMVGHSHKHSTRNEFITDPRGAGAWGGDTTLTSGIFEEDDVRYIVLGKKRYSPRYLELRLELRQSSQTAVDEFSRIQTVILDSVTFDWSSATDREIARESAVEAAAQSKTETLQAVMWEMVRTEPERSMSYYYNKSKEDGGPGHTWKVKQAALNALLVRGELKEVPPRVQRGAEKTVLIVDEERHAALHGGYRI
jgi:hypothetical protein